MRDVAVIGIGMTKWGELWEKSLRTIFVESALLGLEDAGIDRLDSMIVGCMSGGLFTGQEHLGLAARRLPRHGPRSRRPGSSRPAPRAAWPSARASSRSPRVSATSSSSAASRR